MNGNRNRYTSVPTYGMKSRKKQQADFTQDSRFDSASSGGGTPPSSGGGRRFSWLLFVILLLLPILFVLSLLLPGEQVRIVLKAVFLAVALIALCVMLFGRAFGRNARYTVSLVITALMVIEAVSLAVSLPKGTTGRTQASNAQSIYFGGSSALESVSVSTSSAPEASGDTPQGDAAASAAQLQLMAFMNYWGEEQLEQMVSICLPAWVNSQENPKTALFFILANRTPLSYSVDSITGSSADDSRTITITVLIRKTSANDPEYYRMQVLMIRLNNNWYVDPNSLSGTKVTTTGAPDGSVQSVTAAPTDAPTPVPAVSEETMVYYNPQGGAYYHLKETCDKVGAQYEPLTPLYYKDLNSTKYKNLNPCPYCNPPARPTLTGQ